VLGPGNLLVSRDYPGFAVDVVERATGGWAAFANGACGDVNAGHSADRTALGLPVPGRTFERAAELGNRLAEEALRATPAARPLAGVTISAGRRGVNVPLRPTPSPETVRQHVEGSRRDLEVLQSERAAAATDEAITAARLELFYAELARKWVEQRGSATTETVGIQAFAVGDIAFIALPGEFFAESGMRLRSRSPFPCTIPVGYANGGIGYVPPASAFEEGGYETRLSPWSRMAPEAEGLMVDAAVELLHDLLAEEHAPKQTSMKA
jgi:neutral ceramidase